jgi:hypothetical protein
LISSRLITKKNGFQFFIFSCESVITRIKGHELTSEYLLKNGFTKPILISNRDGLELTLPNRMITLEEINELVGMKVDNEIIFLKNLYL